MAKIRKKVCVYDLEGNLLSTHENASRAAKHLGTNSDTVRNHCDGKISGRFGGYFTKMKEGVEGNFRTTADPSKVDYKCHLRWEGDPIQR